MEERASKRGRERERRSKIEAEAQEGAAAYAREGEEGEGKVQSKKELFRSFLFATSSLSLSLLLPREDRRDPQSSFGPSSLFLSLAMSLCVCVCTSPPSPSTSAQLHSIERDRARKQEQRERRAAGVWREREIEGKGQRERGKEESENRAKRGGFTVEEEDDKSPRLCALLRRCYSLDINDRDTESKREREKQRSRTDRSPATDFVPGTAHPLAASTQDHCGPCVRLVHPASWCTCGQRSSEGGETERKVEGEPGSGCSSANISSSLTCARQPTSCVH